MKIWSDAEYVYRCLADKDRTDAFQVAITAAVKPGAVVLDMGTGSGIMALLAAKAGAGKVYAVEIGDYLSRTSEKIFRDSGYGNRIESLRIDAREIGLGVVDKPDVVICEMITTGLIGEMQGPVISSLQKAGLIDSETIVVPAGLDTAAALVHADFNFYDVDLRFPIFADYFSKSVPREREVLSEERVVHSVEFSSPFAESVVIDAAVQVMKAGVVNGLLLKSATRFFGGSEVGPCVSYCQPVILPLDDIRVAGGEVLTVKIAFQMGEGFDSLSYSVDIRDEPR